MNLSNKIDLSLDFLERSRVAIETFEFDENDNDLIGKG